MKIRDLFKLSALALAAAGFSGTAMADTAETKGGLTVKTDDGRFEMKIGGRIHFDGYFATADNARGLISQTNFRRARLSLSGKAYGWNYLFECDLSGTSTDGECFREMWLGRDFFGQTVRIGQAKPFRSMEELTSSNEIMFMERPFATASGIYGASQFATGLFLNGAASGFTWGVSGYNLRNFGNSEAAGEGFGAAARFTFALIASDSAVLHFGTTVSTDRPGDGTANRTAAAAAAGRISSGVFATAIAATDEDRTTYGFELAGKLGPVYAQSEYAHAAFNGTPLDEDVSTYYVQASWLVTGESKPYDAKKAVFKSPKPDASYGAIELKVRHDAIFGHDGGNANRASQWAAGVNYFVNPNVRFMLEFLRGTTYGAATAGEIPNPRASVVQLRSQFNF